MLRTAAGVLTAALLAAGLAACTAPGGGADSAAPDTITVTATSTVTVTPPATSSAQQPSSSPAPPETTVAPPETTATVITSRSTAESTAQPPTTGAGQTIAVTAADRARAAEIVAGMTVRARAASVIMVTGKEAIGTGLLGRYPFGGVILFAPGGVVDGTASGTPSQVAAVTAGLRSDAAADPAGVPPLIATDQEYGAVQRLKNGFTSFPDAATFGSISSIDRATKLARAAATAAASEMRAVGVTVDFAPVFGVTPADGSASAIGQYGRSYGSDPDRVAALVAAAVTGYQRGGVAAVMKHFPGLARISADSHVTLPTLKADCADWNAHEAIPARAGIEAGTLMVMTGHVLMPAIGDTRLPASISPDVVTDLLRGDGSGRCTGMGFGGVTVTDSLQMEPIVAHYNSGAAAVAALQAGEDLLLMPADPVAAVKGIVAAVKDGSLPQQRLDEAAAAVLAVRLASARVPTPPLTVVGSAKHRAIADKVRVAAR